MRSLRFGRDEGFEGPSLNKWHIRQKHKDTNPTFNLFDATGKAVSHTELGIWCVVVFQIGEEMEQLLMEL